MGVSFEEVGAVMAAMSRTGTNASQASTQLRGIMTSLLKPTAGAERALRDMGLTSEGLRNSIREKGLLKRWRI
jgi:TP901 family phage tail tape measure protein